MRPNPTPLAIRPSDIQRFLSKIDTSDPDGCWSFPSNIAKDGYGRFQLRRRCALAHRVAYWMFIGPIPEDHVVDHTCHNDTTCPGAWDCLHRRCVNPRHLEAVPQRINVLRGQGFAAAYAKRTACKNGHAYTPETIYWFRGARICRVCMRVNHAKRMSKG